MFEPSRRTFSRAAVPEFDEYSLYSIAFALNGRIWGQIHDQGSPFYRAIAEKVLFDGTEEQVDSAYFVLTMPDGKHLRIEVTDYD